MALDGLPHFQSFKACRAVGLQEACTGLCIEFFLLALSCGVENPSLLKNFFLMRDNPGFFLAVKYLLCSYFVFSCALEEL